MPQIKVGSPEHVKLWAAINVYAETCGGNVGPSTITDNRAKAVVVVEEALRDCGVEVVGYEPEGSE